MSMIKLEESQELMSVSAIQHPGFFGGIRIMGE